MYIGKDALADPDWVNEPARIVSNLWITDQGCCKLCDPHMPLRPLPNHYFTVHGTSTGGIRYELTSAQVIITLIMLPDIQSPYRYLTDELPMSTFAEIAAVSGYDLKVGQMGISSERLSIRSVAICRPKQCVKSAACQSPIVKPRGISTYACTVSGTHR